MSRRFLPFLLVLAAAGCNRVDSPPDLNAGDRTRQARIFLISIDEGVLGQQVGCGDRAVPVDVELPLSTPALEGSLEALLAAGKRHESAGLYNAIADSPLRLERIERSGNAVRIYLAGYLELGGECDSPRVLAQLSETATQFRDVETAELFLDGKPLRELLSGKG